MRINSNIKKLIYLIRRILNQGWYLFVSSVYLLNEATKAAFEAIVRLPRNLCDIPTVPMTDETASDSTVIWHVLQAAARTWRGKGEVHIPNYPLDRKLFWGAYALRNDTPLLLPVLEQFTQESSGEGKSAIDLGCGNGPVTTHLLEKRWSVIAVDNSRLALSILSAKNQKAIAEKKLSIVEADITTYTPQEPADLVVASDSLPYTDPSQFRATLTKIHDRFVKRGGFFIGTLFCSTHDLRLMNILKEMGAWMLWDKRMVRPLVTSAGFEMKTDKYVTQDGSKEEAVAIQFIAQKT
jgi:SAM-dependent methyltransferase